MNRKEEQEKYDKLYSDIPRDYEERLSWMVDKYKVSPKMMDNIITKKRQMQSNLMYYDYMVIEYAYIHAKSRPRYRNINRKNYASMAKVFPSFIQVYSPNAQADHRSMHRLIGQELEELNLFIQTPCTIIMNVYEPTPAGFSIPDIFLAEYGLIPSISDKDYDNYLKATSDRLNTNLWLDDSLVVSGTVNKLYSILPRQEIFIRYLNIMPNKYQYNNVVNRKGYNKDYPINYLDKDGNPYNQN